MLAVSCAGALCVYLRGLLPPNGILPGAKFTLHPSTRAVGVRWAVGVSQTAAFSRGRSYIRQGVYYGIAEFTGLEIAGMENDGLENDGLENDGLEFVGL